MSTFLFNDGIHIHLEQNIDKQGRFKSMKIPLSEFPLLIDKYYKTLTKQKRNI